jgi:hypothetical protein
MKRKQEYTTFVTRLLRQDFEGFFWRDPHLFFYVRLPRHSPQIGTCMTLKDLRQFMMDRYEVDDQEPLFARFVRDYEEVLAKCQLDTPFPEEKSPVVDDAAIVHEMLTKYFK